MHDLTCLCQLQGASRVVLNFPKNDILLYGWVTPECCELLIFLYSDLFTVSIRRKISDTIYPRILGSKFWPLAVLCMKILKGMIGEVLIFCSCSFSIITIQNLSM